MVFVGGGQQLHSFAAALCPALFTAASSHHTPDNAHHTTHNTHNTQSSRSAYDEDALLSIRLLGADVTGPLTFVLLAAAGWQAYTNDLYGQLTGRRGGRKGRWVYDRSLGGKKVREAVSFLCCYKLAVLAEFELGWARGSCLTP